MAVERFEDLIAWQKARGLTRETYQITQQGTFTKDFGLSGQIQRAAVSVMSNIAEGFERGGRGEFHRFFLLRKPLVPKFVPNSMWRSMLVT